MPYGDPAKVVATERARVADALDGLDVLVIEDEKDIRSAMRTLLEGWGCNVATADCGAAADAALAERAMSPDVILADYRLPDGNGMHVIRRIRESHPDASAVVISGDIGADVLKEAEASGYHILRNKPLQPARAPAARCCWLGSILARAQRRDSHGRRKRARRDEDPHGRRPPPHPRRHAPRPRAPLGQGSGAGARGRDLRRRRGGRIVASRPRPRPAGPAPAGYIDSFEALEGLQSRFPGLPVVLMSGEDDPALVRDALDRGALGYIPKSSTTEVILNALRLVLSGGTYVPLEAIGLGAPSAARVSPAPADVGAKLGITPRQAEVLALLLDGKSNKVISRELNLAESTVKNHVAAVFRALDVTTRVQAVLAASKLGIKS